MGRPVRAGRVVRPRDGGRLRCALAAVLVLAVVGLPGCSVTAPTGPRVGASVAAAAVPRVGDCWSAPDGDAAESWTWWQGAPPVDCATEHNAITLAVGQLPDDFPYEPDGDGSLPLVGEKLGAVAAACRVPGWEGIGLREGSRVTSLWYLPTPREWAAGARWVRCDIALVAFGPLSPLTLEPLPPTADALVPGLAEEYRLCLDTKHPAIVYGPWYDPEANSAVPCGPDAQWELGFRVQLPDGPFPGGQDASSPDGQRCQELVNSRAPERWGGQYESPNAETWVEGSRGDRCWLR